MAPQETQKPNANRKIDHQTNEPRPSSPAEGACDYQYPNHCTVKTRHPKFTSHSMPSLPNLSKETMLHEHLRLSFTNFMKINQQPSHIPSSLSESLLSFGRNEQACELMGNLTDCKRYVWDPGRC